MEVADGAALVLLCIFKPMTHVEFAKQCTMHTGHTLRTARILGSWFIDIKKETDWQGTAHKGC